MNTGYEVTKDGATYLSEYQIDVLKNLTIQEAVGLWNAKDDAEKDKVRKNFREKRNMVFAGLW